MLPNKVMAHHQKYDPPDPQHVAHPQSTIDVQRLSYEAVFVLGLLQSA